MNKDSSSGTKRSRALHRLTAKEVTTLPAGTHHDGGGLYLLVDAGSRSWAFRYTIDGKERRIGLGPVATVSLADAREKAHASRAQVTAGIDPKVQREADRSAARLEAAKAISFGQAAQTFIDSHEAGWRNAKHRQQWTNTLKTYVAPIIGHLPVSAVDTDLVLRCIEPIWAKKPETANRVRGRIEMILDAAKARGQRSGENPARWRGHLDQVLPKRSKLRRAHQPALPFVEVPAFMADLRKRPGIAARALELAILCAVRTGDIIGNDRDEKPPMLWRHVNLNARVWTIPGTKTDTEHRVPLSEAAVRLLRDLEKTATGEIVFSGANGGQPLSNMALTTVIRRMNDDRSKRHLPRYVDPKQGNRDVVPHGFRSSFRDWAAETTGFANHVVEKALAHEIESKVEGAYRRGDLFEKRRPLMDAWERFVSSTGATVLPIRAQA